MRTAGEYSPHWWPFWRRCQRISPRTCHLLVKRDKLARLEQFLELAGGLLKVFLGHVHPPGVAVCKYVPAVEQLASRPR